MTIPKQYQCGFDVFLAQLYPDMQCQVHVLDLVARVYIQVQESQLPLLHILSSPNKFTLSNDNTEIITLKSVSIMGNNYLLHRRSILND
ncbi:hypothetical protein T05_6985 [Trichinella murrelli]|uniref:Uncharacterized protein n=1 Tax=Trichinella murrelli TaxID=144512 RepID=A0A0V0T3Y0_9BILA|nr:hypothetical protein T05_6985 [Trichinella murrelli]